jgi:hypothetical protein
MRKTRRNRDQGSVSEASTALRKLIDTIKSHPPTVNQAAKDYLEMCISLVSHAIVEPVEPRCELTVGISDDGELRVMIRSLVSYLRLQLIMSGDLSAIEAWLGLVGCLENLERRAARDYKLHRG